jgi:dTDP-4-dehydrorhamnose reductase
MRALITGAHGQLGAALQRFAPADCEIVAHGHNQLDITEASTVNAVLATESIDVLINAAAYTNVEAAQRTPEAAFKINAEGPAILASACADRNVHFVHVSTDFVFDGTKGAPYSVEDEPRPLNVYGVSKLAGERRIQDILGNRAAIVRTSWLHSASGANFVTKVLSQIQAGKTLRVVIDEVGAPTAVHSLAPALWQCAIESIGGIHHWSDTGSTNRFDYARAISALALEYELISEVPQILPARATEFSTAVNRAAYSVLATDVTQAALGIRAQPWLEGLKLTMQDLRRQHKAEGL